jgi:hypothetical protein
MSFVVRFDFPEGQTFYSGLADGAAGFAPTIQTATIFDDEDGALRCLRFAYGDAIAAHGRVVRLVEGEPVARG